MDHSTFESTPWLIPFFILGIWLFVSILSGLLSGWYSLARDFPDRDEAEWFCLKSQSGSMGIVHMRSILNIAVCPSGLRIGTMRILNPFCPKLFVPWDQIQVQREERLFWGRTAVLWFGNRSAASLRLPGDVADRLARSSQGRWPETGSFAEDKSGLRRTLLRQWALSTIAVSLFFILVPRFVSPNTSGFPPVAVAILFPAIVFGIGALISYRRRMARTR